MPDDRTRLRLHQRLTELLDADLADAMMESMPPMPWDELATKQDLAALTPQFEAIDRRFEAIDRRFESMDRRFDAIDERFDLLVSYIDTKLDGKIDALEGRLALRWMETTRIIVLAMMVLFVGVVGLAIRLGG